jgi:hypothetical protein
MRILATKKMGKDEKKNDTKEGDQSGRGEEKGETEAAAKSSSTKKREKSKKKITVAEIMEDVKKQEVRACAYPRR